MWLWKGRLRKFERGWSARVLLKYILLQLPGVVLPALLIIGARKWFDFSYWFVFIGIFLLVAKDVILFPFVWRAYEQGSPHGIEAMKGFLGVTEERLAPEGFIRVRGELWRARVVHSNMVIEEGTKVRVVGGRGLILSVEPQPQNDDRPPTRNFDNPSKT